MDAMTKRRGSMKIGCSFWVVAGGVNVSIFFWCCVSGCAGEWVCVGWKGEYGGEWWMGECGGFVPSCTSDQRDAGAKEG